MLPSSNQGLGMDIGFPDVCLTPAAPAPIPVPYPALNQNAMAVPFCPTILLSFCPAHNQSAKSMMTNGDNAGVAHPSVMMPGSNTMGNPRVLLQGLPAETLTNPMTANNMNGPLSAKLVPSLTNCLIGFRAAEEGLLGLVAELADRPGGLGLALERERGGWRVLHARRGGRGARAGLRAGDLLLRGLRVRRPGRGPERQVAFPLAVDPRPVIAWLDRDGVGRLVVRRCSWGAPRALALALSQLRDAGARALVLDLRGNPGGDVRVAAALVEPLLADAALPLTVLLDGGTASAAELLAATLAEAGRGVLAGARSAGKSQGQVLAWTAAGSVTSAGSEQAMPPPGGSACRLAALGQARPVAVGAPVSLLRPGGARLGALLPEVTSAGRAAARARRA